MLVVLVVVVVGELLPLPSLLLPMRLPPSSTCWKNWGC